MGQEIKDARQKARDKRRGRHRVIVICHLSFLICILAVFSSPLFAQEVNAQADTADKSAGDGGPPPLKFAPDTDPQQIVIKKETVPLSGRLQRQISIDVRDMSIVDIIRFLALKGNFNVVMASNIQGRATFNLKSVRIKDALDIAVISNRLAYVMENDIIRVMTEEEYEALYGRSFSDKRTVRIIHLQYAKPSYVLAALEGIKSRIGQVIIDEDTGNVVLIDTPESISAMMDVIGDIEKPLETIVYPLEYAKADVVAEKLSKRIDSQSVGSITVDERSNKLVVRAFPGRKQEIEKVIKSLDTPTKEVLVEARVLQVVFNPQMDYGIDWQLDFSKNNLFSGLNFKNILLDKSNLTSSSNLFSKFGEIGYGDINVDQFELAIRALKQVSDTKILSNPKILVTNNQEAKIHVGDTIPYIISTTSGTGGNAITSEDVRFVDVGLQLNVTPTINDDGYVTMSLRPEISTVVGKIQSKGGGIPQINKTEVETTVMIRNGMTIILGGLKKDNKVSIKTGVPVLMDIPILGHLFRASSEDIQSTEIVIFITPHIVTGNESYQQLRGTVKGAKGYSNEEKAAVTPPSEHPPDGGKLRIKN